MRVKVRVKARVKARMKAMGSIGLFAQAEKEYGDIGEYLRLEGSPMLKKLSMGSYVQIVGRRLLGLGEAEEVECPKCYGTGADYYGSSGSCRSCGGRGKDFSGALHKGLIGAFYNRMTPSRLIEERHEINIAWYALVDRPIIIGSSYNWRLDVFARLYCFFGGENLLKLSSKVIPARTAETMLKLIDSGRQDLAVKLARSGIDTAYLTMSEVKRFLRAPKEVKWLLKKAISYLRSQRTPEGPLAGINFLDSGRVIWENVALVVRNPEYDQYYFPRKALWKKYQGFIPKSQLLLEGVDAQNISAFDKKTFQFAEKRFRKTMEGEGNIISCAIKAQMLFSKANLGALLEYINRHKDVSDHDFMSTLMPSEASKETGDFIVRHKDASMESLSVVSAGYCSLDEEERKLPIRDMVAVIRSKVYVGAGSASLASEAAKWGVSEEAYPKLEESWLTALSSQEREDIPYLCVEEEGYSIFRLGKADPRALWLGQYTDCCQSIGGVGQSCAWHGVKEPTGAFFVVTDKKGEIIAQSWTWRDKDIICFDNIEAKGMSYDEESKRKEIIVSLYNKLAAKMIGVLCIKQVNVGLGYMEPDLCPWKQIQQEDDQSVVVGNPIGGRATPPNGVYTDAGNQALIAKE